MLRHVEDTARPEISANVEKDVATSTLMATYEVLEDARKLPVEESEELSKRESKRHGHGEVQAGTDGATVASSDAPTSCLNRSSRTMSDECSAMKRWAIDESCSTDSCLTHPAGNLNFVCECVDPNL
jgi:hypothetical protein